MDELADMVERAARSSGTEVRIARSHGSMTVAGPGSTQLSRARAALEELDALALDTAEHHPYWEALSLCCQISRAVLDGWDSEVGRDDAEQARWSASRLAESCSRL